MNKPTFEVTSGFLLNLLKVAKHLNNDHERLLAFEMLKRAEGVMTEMDVKPIEDLVKSHENLPESLRPLASVIEGLLDKDPHKL